MNKFFISVIVFFGFLLMSNNSFACGNGSGKHSCEKEVTSKADKENCCNNKQSKDKGSSCGGKCGHSNCTSSSSINFSIISFFEVNFINNSFDFSEEKLKFHHSKTFISSGFYSIWLIPKIG